MRQPLSLKLKGESKDSIRHYNLACLSNWNKTIFIPWKKPIPSCFPTLTFNEQFGNKTKLSVFEEVPNPSERNLILARLAERVVDSGHHIRFQNRYYIPTEQGKEVYFIRKTKALVIKAFDGDIYLNIADKIYHTKELLNHELYSKNFEQEPEQKKKDASISLHKPIRGNSHLSNNIFIKIKRIMKSLLVRSLILLNYKYSKMK